MNDRQHLDDAVRTWIRSEAAASAPGRLRDAVRDEVAVTEQVGPRRSRLADFTWAGLSSQAVAALVVVVVAAGVVGLVAVRRLVPGNVPVPSPSALPTATPPASALPTVAPTPPGTLLPQGVVTSVALVPAITASMPAGWTLQLDSRDLFILVRPDAGWVRQLDGLVLFDDVAIFARPVPGQADGSREPVPGVGTSARDLATWLSARPQLDATAPVETTLAGQAAYRVDFRIGPSAGELCGVPCANLFFGPTLTSYAFGIAGNQLDRAYLLEAPNGDVVMVCIEDTDGSGIEAEVRAAAPILDSLAFQQ